jgi:predicted phage terminase large subunit-like protein
MTTTSQKGTVRPDIRVLTEVLGVALRTDFISFVHKVFHLLNPGAVFHLYWFVRALAFHLEQVRLGKVTRLIINLPPRMGKSTVSSIAFPAFMLGHDPTKRIIVASHSADLAVKLGNDFRDVMRAPFYQRAFPATRPSRSKNTEYEFVTSGRGYRLGTSMDGSVTGRGADILIIDDPIKPNDALSNSKRERVNNLLFNNLLSRLDNKRTGAIILAMQRAHPEDPVAAVLRSSTDWVVLSFPAISEQDELIQIGKDQFHLRRRGDVLDPEREPRSVLDSIRKDIGPDAFAAQYQQAPVPPDGAMIKRSWIRRYDQIPVRTSTSLVTQSWDTGLTQGEQSSYSVCTTWLIEDNKRYLIDCLRERLDYPELRERALAHARLHTAHRILVEKAGFGDTLANELKLAGFAAIVVKPEHDKRTRMAIQAAKIKAGLVVLPKEAPWLEEYEAELFGFPGSRYSDQIDSTSQALADEIRVSPWNDRANENFANFVQGVALHQAFGRLAGRPWLEAT